MTEKNIQMQKKNADGSFDVYYPKTKAANVIAADGSNLESHLAEMMPHKTADGAYKYGWKVQGGDLIFMYEEVE